LTLQILVQKSIDKRISVSYNKSVESVGQKHDRDRRRDVLQCCISRKIPTHFSLHVLLQRKSKNADIQDGSMQVVAIQAIGFREVSFCIASSELKRRTPIAGVPHQSFQRTRQANRKRFTEKDTMTPTIEATIDTTEQPMPIRVIRRVNDRFEFVELASEAELTASERRAAFVAAFGIYGE
jgi:hypothetical protein